MIRISIDAKDFSEATRALAEKFSDRKVLHQIIGEVLYDQTVDRFQREISPSGQPWARLSPLTLSLRRSQKGILCDRGSFSALSIALPCHKPQPLVPTSIIRKC